MSEHQRACAGTPVRIGTRASIHVHVRREHMRAGVHVRVHGYYIPTMSERVFGLSNYSPQHAKLFNS